MVNLGLIKDKKQAPAHFNRVAFELGSPLSPAAVHAAVTSWPRSRKTQGYCLTLSVPPGLDHLPQWAPRMGRILADMGWTDWWLDTDSLSRVIGAYTVDCLPRWGQSFWPTYEAVLEHNPSILIPVGAQRAVIFEFVTSWVDIYPAVSFSEQLDFDKHQKDKEALRQERIEKVKGFFKGNFLSSRPGA